MRVLLALWVGAVLLAACDGAPGLPETSSTPVLSDLVYSPTTVAIGTSATTVTLDVSVRVDQVPATTAAPTVSYALVPSFGTSVLASGTLSRRSDGRWGGTLTLPLTRENAGQLTLIVTASTLDGVISNEVRGTVQVVATTQRPPSIDAIDAPTTFRPPGTLRFVVTASDPDGLGNLASVTIRTPAGSTLSMFDDGATQGDAVAGDGRYTAAFDVPSATPGPQTFVFQARDRDGLTSAEVPFTVTIQ